MHKTLLAFLALLLVSTQATANPITSGSASFWGSGFRVNAAYHVSGSNFSAEGGGQNVESVGMAPCLHVFSSNDVFDGCASGDVVQLSATSGLWTSGAMSGRLTIDGQDYSLDFFSSGEIDFTGSSVILPYSKDPRVGVSAPFSMTGFLVARDSTGSAGLTLSGSGIASMILNNIGVDASGNRVYELERISYSFAMPVEVDVKPGDDVNYINLKSRGNVPVAILSTAAFDASAVNPVTVTVAGAAVALKPNGTSKSSLKDVNDDGLLDLVVHVSTEALQLTNPDLAMLEGHTFDGNPIWGSDDIVVVHESKRATMH